MNTESPTAPAPGSILPGVLVAAGLLAVGLVPGDSAPGALDALWESGLNRADVARMEHGYYEHLLDAGRRLDGEGVEPSGARPAPAFAFGWLAVPVADLREHVLIPNHVTEVRGARWTTNSSGLRDREYARVAGVVPTPARSATVTSTGVGTTPATRSESRARIVGCVESSKTHHPGTPMGMVRLRGLDAPYDPPPARSETSSPTGVGTTPATRSESEASKLPGTFRVALLGDSIAAGWGVPDGRNFESLAEVAWDEASKAGGGPAVEVWNFAVPGHAPGQRLEHFRRIGGPSNPDLLIYEATPADLGWDGRRLRGLLPIGLGFDAPQYRDALTTAGARPGGDFDGYDRLLRPHRWAILEGVYRTIVADCRARGVRSAWVLLPRIGRAIEPGERDRLLRLARAAGFDAVFDLTDAYEGLDSSTLAVAADDHHPNALGHARLAARLLEAFASRPDLLPIATPPPAGGPR